MTFPGDLVLQLSGRLAAAFAADVLDGALVLLLVGLLLRLLPNPGAATRSVVWTGVLIVVAAMPFLPSGMARSAAQTLPQASHALRFAPVWSLRVVLVWLVASAVRAIGLVAGAWRLRRISLSAVPVPTLEGGGVQSVRSAGGFGPFGPALRFFCGRAAERHRLLFASRPHSRGPLPAALRV